MFPTMSGHGDAATAGIEIRTSSIHGTGMFATEAISEGADLIEYVGESIGFAEAMRREFDAAFDHGRYIFKVRDDLFIDGSRGGNIARFVNHSCEPNCFIRNERDKVWIVAKRDIALGEELSFDYAYDVPVPDQCRCGSPRCRGTMTSVTPAPHAA